VFRLLLQEAKYYTAEDLDSIKIGLGVKLILCCNPLPTGLTHGLQTLALSQSGAWKLPVKLRDPVVFPSSTAVFARPGDRVYQLVRGKESELRPLLNEEWNIPIAVPRESFFEFSSWLDERQAPSEVVFCSSRPPAYPEETWEILKGWIDEQITCLFPGTQCEEVDLNNVSEPKRKLEELLKGNSHVIGLFHNDVEVEFEKVIQTTESLATALLAIFLAIRSLLDESLTNREIIELANHFYSKLKGFCRTMMVLKGDNFKPFLVLKAGKGFFMVKWKELPPPFSKYKELYLEAPKAKKEVIREIREKLIQETREKEDVVFALDVPFEIREELWNNLEEKRNVIWIARSATCEDALDFWKYWRGTEGRVLCLLCHEGSDECVAFIRKGG